jgi:hypothetical protein
MLTRLFWGDITVARGHSRPSARVCRQAAAPVSADVCLVSTVWQVPTYVMMVHVTHLYTYRCCTANVQRGAPCGDMLHLCTASIRGPGIRTRLRPMFWTQPLVHVVGLQLRHCRLHEHMCLQRAALQHRVNLCTGQAEAIMIPNFFARRRERAQMQANAAQQIQPASPSSDASEGFVDATSVTVSEASAEQVTFNPRLQCSCVCGCLARAPRCQLQPLASLIIHEVPQAHPFSL